MSTGIFVKSNLLQQYKLEQLRTKVLKYNPSSLPPSELLKVMNAKSLEEIGKILKKNLER